MPTTQEIDMDIDFDWVKPNQTWWSLDDSTTQGSSGQRLKLSSGSDKESLRELSYPNLDYLHWLRIVVLRSLLDTPARAALHGEFGYSMRVLAGFLGMPNLQDYCAAHELIQVRTLLKSILAEWEARYGSACRFPDHLQGNLSSLAAQVNLSATETELLGLCIVLVTEPIAESLSNVIGEIVGYRVDRCLAPMLGYTLEDVAPLLNTSSTLHTTGLLQFEPRREQKLRSLIELLTYSFACEMLKPQHDIRILLRDFIEPVTAASPALTPNDYQYVGEDTKLCISLLTGALHQHRQGVNILIWGEPGTGKTQFVRMLAQQVKVQLLEVCPHDSSGEPIAPNLRVRNFNMAQKFYGDQPCLLMFDECEEVLPKRFAPFSDESGIGPRKSWINKTLETNAIPTFWIANSLEDFDSAYLRRFSLCMEMPTAPLSQRCEILTRTLGNAISPQALTRIAEHDQVTPGILSKAAEVLEIMTTHSAPQEDHVHDERVIHMINSTLKAQGKAPIVEAEPKPQQAHFEPAWLNTQVDLHALCSQLRKTPNARLCLSGPPGTGKTAFGQWLAAELGMKHLSYKVSDLLSRYVGETEKEIAAAFARAREEQAVLQFDEVDSFLQERSRAAKQWEITQVNQMLTELDAYEGVFIATTNLADQLDTASLRRFDITLEFGHLSAEAAHQMFIRTCQALGLDDASTISTDQVVALGALTPGDFAQLQRRARLIAPTSSTQVLRALAQAMAQKHSRPQRSIGFLCSH